MKAKILITIMIISFGFCNPLLAHAQYEVYVNPTTNYELTTYMVTMRDGVKLATDVFTPDLLNGGSESVVLIRT
ncbi:MAG: hypothetical protein ACTSQB_02865, partial [Candidatus Heimdallarchaeota archaeon]